MASIYVSSVDETSASMYLKGLDTNWSKGTRYTYWTITSGRTTQNSSGKSISNGASSGGNVSFNGLTAGTTYSVTCVVTYSNSELPDDDDTETVATITGSFTTNSSSTTTTDPIITSITSSTDGLDVEIYVTIYNPDDVSFLLSAECEVKYARGHTSSGSYDYYTYYIAYGSAGKYSVAFELYNQDNNGALCDSGSITITVTESSASIEVTAYTETSATMHLINLDTSWGQGTRAPHWYLRKGSAVSVDSSTHDPYSSGYDLYQMGSYIANYASSGGDVTFTELDSGSTYYIYCVVKYSKSGTATYVASFTGSFSTKSSTRKYFSWTSDSLLTSKPSSNSPISSGEKISTYLTATRWNNLQTVINELRELKNYSTYSFSSSAVTGNKLTASMYNECVYAITAMSGATASSYTVSSGDTVTAAKINWLQSAVNSLSV